MKITFIGGGNMAGAILAGLARQGGHALQVVEPDAAKRDALARDHGVVPLQTPPAFAADEVVVLAVKPQQLKAVCEGIADRLNGALVLSIAAGVRVEALSRWLNGHTRIVRIMPNTPAMVGRGVAGVYAPQELAEADAEAAETVMRAVGEVVRLADETGIDDITAVSGSGPAYVFYFIEAMMAGAVKQGFDADTARALVLATFDGAVELARQSPLDVATLRQNVTSKGGTTERAIARFDAEGVKAAIVAGMDDCRARSIELGQLLSQD
ncbi:pyrroline-5-carboxylate reductase [Crenobacter luteus]|uniref:Pyrroline-5-carboxylate reductase n=1 Tax=Crenobacter luteus TaxID=1452487 RepID=A0A165EXH2_9NEIS|nr:pyrroline-5-carboxylate reductase [Crenobacter luteus]KZE28901.1 pyrroline-5-carboxylate reductase [Crenobacter luteus]